MKNPGVVPAKLKEQVIPDENLGEIYNTSLLNADSYGLLRTLAMHIKGVEPAKDVFIKKSNRNTLIPQMIAALPFYMQLNVNNAEYFDKFRNKFDTEIQAGFIKQPLLKYYAS